MEEIDIFFLGMIIGLCIGLSVMGIADNVIINDMSNQLSAAHNASRELQYKHNALAESYIECIDMHIDAGTGQPQFYISEV